METYLSVLAPGLVARPLLEWAAAFRDRTVEMGDVTAYELAHDNPRGSSGVKHKAVLKTDGFNAWAGVGLAFLVAGEAHE